MLYYVLNAVGYAHWSIRFVCEAMRGRRHCADSADTFINASVIIIKWMRNGLRPVRELYDYTRTHTITNIQNISH